VTSFWVFSKKPDKATKISIEGTHEGGVKGSSFHDEAEGIARARLGIPEHRENMQKLNHDMRYDLYESSTLIGFSITNHPLLGTFIFRNPHIVIRTY